MDDSYLLGLDSFVVDSECYTTCDFLSPYGCEVCGKRGGLRKREGVILCPFHRRVLFSTCLGKRYLSTLNENFCSFLGYGGRCRRVIFKDKRRCSLHRKGGLESLNLLYFCS